MKIESPNANRRARSTIAFLAVGVLVGASPCLYGDSSEGAKLYWLVPDGMRADPSVFDVFGWARSGRLPNLGIMLEEGAFGYSVPTFPSHTPTNFATLFTGAHPRRHGVADGPMRVQGRELGTVSSNGFSSTAKWLDPIWVTMEKNHRKTVVLLSVPGSTPPELDRGVTVRGRWGGWGPDFVATNFERKEGGSGIASSGSDSRLFFRGPRLTERVGTKIERRAPVRSHSPVHRADLLKHGTLLYAFIYDSTDNGTANYDRIAFSLQDRSLVADLRQGEWSPWIPTILTWRPQGKEVPIKSALKIKVIELEDDGFFRIRVIYDNHNKYSINPGQMAGKMRVRVGPMVDFADNFPPQLIRHPLDKGTFVEEAEMSFEWHQGAMGYLLDAFKPDLYIGDIYTPNQMLTSRWWMGYLDPASTRYGDVSEQARSV